MKRVEDLKWGPRCQGIECEVVEFLFCMKWRGGGDRNIEMGCETQNQIFLKNECGVDELWSGIKIGESKILTT